MINLKQISKSIVDIIVKTAYALDNLMGTNFILAMDNSVREVEYHAEMKRRGSVLKRRQ